MPNGAPLPTPPDPLSTVLARIDAAAGRAGRAVRLLAVSKGQPEPAVRRLAAAGQHAFGENYLQEALARMDALAGLELEWHFIGRLQSNKAREVARRFDWIQSVDRRSLLGPLVRGREGVATPLNVLLQVNVDGEAGKGGCPPTELAELADAVAAEPRLRLRGLMAIPMPAVMDERRRAFAALRGLYERLGDGHALDTLSMGMSDDFEVAIAEGSTMVRIGTALFGPRPT